MTSKGRDSNRATRLLYFWFAIVVYFIS